MIFTVFKNILIKFIVKNYLTIFFKIIRTLLVMLFNALYAVILELKS